MRQNIFSQWTADGYSKKPFYFSLETTTKYVKKAHKFEEIEHLPNNKTLHTTRSTLWSAKADKNVTFKYVKRLKSSVCIKREVRGAGGTHIKNLFPNKDNTTEISWPDLIYSQVSFGRVACVLEYNLA